MAHLAEPDRAPQGTTGGLGPRPLYPVRGTGANALATGGSSVNGAWTSRLVGTLVAVCDTPGVVC
jgi:hypothetical protein